MHMSAKTGPFRILPARVRAAFEYLSYSISVEHGCGEPSVARDLDGIERATKTASLRCLQQYLSGEQDMADVLHYAYPVPAEMMRGGIIRCESSNECEEIAMQMDLDEIEGDNDA